MKNLKLLAFSFIAMLLMVVNVNAEEVSVNDLTEFEACIKVAGNTCKLNGNLDVTTSYELEVDVTIDLNGYTITALDSVSGNAIFNVLRGATLTINDTSEAATGKITVGENTDVNAVVFLTKKGEAADGPVAGVVVNGGTLEGYYYAIAGNGGRHNTSMEINGGKLLGLNEADNVGIYHPQIGTLKITGGTITGLTGIEMRAGTINVTGGTIVGTASTLAAEPNGSGSTTTGAGIAISQHTTRKDITLNISGGKVQGKAALYEVTPESNPNPEIIKLNVTGGTFEAINGGTSAVDSEHFTNFVTGGTFNTVDAKYVASDVKTATDKDGNVLVGKEYKVSIKEVAGGTIEVDKTNALKGETVTLKLTPNEGYLLDKVTVLDANEEEVSVSGNTFVMPDSDVTVTVKFKEHTIEVDVPVADAKEEGKTPVVGAFDEDAAKEVLLDSLGKDTDLVDKLKSRNGLVSLDITSMDVSEKELEEVEKLVEKDYPTLKAAYAYDISVNVSEAGTGFYLGGISELTKAIKFNVVLGEELRNVPEGYTRTIYAISTHDKEVSVTKLTVSEDGKTGSFEASQFSTYVLGYVDTKNETPTTPENPTTPETPVDPTPETPKTLDNITLYIALGVMSAAAIVISVKNLKKRVTR